VTFYRDFDGASGVAYCLYFDEGRRGRGYTWITKRDVRLQCYPATLPAAVRLHDGLAFALAAGVAQHGNFDPLFDWLLDAFPEHETFLAPFITANREVERK
jgi:hypothetical protein